MTNRHTHRHTHIEFLLPGLTAGAAHLPGDQILCGGTVSTSWQEAAHRTLKELGPAEDQLLLFCTAGPLRHATLWPYCAALSFTNMFQRKGILLLHIIFVLAKYWAKTSACLSGRFWVRYHPPWASKNARSPFKITSNNVCSTCISQDFCLV